LLNATSRIRNRESQRDGEIQIILKVIGEIQIGNNTSSVRRDSLGD
jgi:hypothetical protein